MFTFHSHELHFAFLTYLDESAHASIYSENVIIHFLEVKLLNEKLTYPHEAHNVEKLTKSQQQSSLNFMSYTWHKN